MVNGYYKVNVLDLFTVVFVYVCVIFFCCCCFFVLNIVNLKYTNMELHSYFRIKKKKKKKKKKNCEHLNVTSSYHSRFVCWFISSLSPSSCLGLPSSNFQRLMGIPLRWDVFKQSLVKSPSPRSKTLPVELVFFKIIFGG